MAVLLDALVVEVKLHVLDALGGGEVLEGDGGGRDGGWEAEHGGGRHGAVVHDVEARDGEVVVVVREPLGEVELLIFDGEAERDVF